MPKTSKELSALHERIKLAYEKIQRAKDRRQSANDTIAAARSDLEEAGIPKKALGAAMVYINMDPDDREGFDIAYAVVREALGYPVNAQGDILEFIADRQREEEEAERAAEGEGASASH